LNQKKAGHKYIAAICASPALVLAPNGFLNGHKATCYPSMIDKLPDSSDADKTVVISDKLSKICSYL
jgi:protein deglycase